MRQLRISTNVRCLAILTSVVVTVLLTASPALRWVDRNLFQEEIKDIWGRMHYDEDWRSAVILPVGLNYSWLNEANRPLLVAHALGESGQRGGNSISALQRSLAKGLLLLEIDVWFDDQGILRCHHGPDIPGVFRLGDCTLLTALRAAVIGGGWLVLDIKTDFATTGEAILQSLGDDPAAERLIFQIYRPADVNTFSNWSLNKKLAGPIVTAYRSRRSLKHVAYHAARIGVHALTIPIERGSALGKVPPSLVVLVHTIHSCEAVRSAASLSSDGMYINSELVPAFPKTCFQ